MKGVFVTGTDTGVGKTLFAAALLLRLGEAGVQAAAYKPVAAGCRRLGGTLWNADAELLAAAAPLRLPVAEVNPVALEAAVAPHLAAADAGIALSAEDLAAAAPRAGYLVVEGAGGWLVPLGEHETLADLARRLGLPIVLVVGLRLGCLNHALLSAAAVRADGQHLAGWVANPLDASMPRADDNIAALEARLGAPLLARLPHCPAADPLARARQAATAIGPAALRLLIG